VPDGGTGVGVTLDAVPGPQLDLVDRHLAEMVPGIPRHADDLGTLHAGDHYMLVAPPDVTGAARRRRSGAAHIR
jgi:hypothetical protein